MKDHNKEIPTELIEELKKAGFIGAWDGHTFENWTERGLNKNETRQNRKSNSKE